MAVTAPREYSLDSTVVATRSKVAKEKEEESLEMPVVHASLAPGVDVVESLASKEATGTGGRVRG